MIALLEEGERVVTVARLGESHVHAARNEKALDALHLSLLHRYELTLKTLLDCREVVLVPTGVEGVVSACIQGGIAVRLCEGAFTGEVLWLQRNRVLPDSFVVRVDQ